MNWWIITSLLLNLITFSTPQCVENANVKIANIDSSIKKKWSFDIGHSQIRQLAFNIKDTEATNCTWVVSSNEMVDDVFFALNINELGSSTEYYPAPTRGSRGTYCFRFLPVGFNETVQMKFECKRGNVVVDSINITINILNN
jgi:hypothetical protein